MSARSLTLSLATALAALAAGGAALPAMAAEAPKPAASPDGDEKLPAQLPSVTIQGQDLSSAGDRGNKLAPTSPTSASRVRLPEPPQTRATRENNRQLMVNVTPTTLEAPPALPPARLPYTQLLAGYGPITQYRLGLYDARTWGPVLGLTDLGGHAGWQWSGWRAEENLDWKGIGRANLRATGYGWSPAGASGNQTFFAGSLDHDEGTDWSAGLDLDRGQANTTGAASLLTSTARLRGRWRPTTGNEHQPQFDLTGQQRQWGVQNGPEGYFQMQDFWSLSDQVQLQGGLGGGYWGREPILDPMAAFHYRPTPATHLYASLKTATEVPDFESLYLERAYTGAAMDLQSERVEGWAQVGGSHRLTDALWGALDLGFRRSFRHIYWADPQGTGLWTPMNAAGEQWNPTAALRAQYQWTDGAMVEVGYSGSTVFPLDTTEHALSGRVDVSLLEKRLTASIGADAKLAVLSATQLPGGGSASGVFAKAQLTYRLTENLNLGLHASDVPLILDRTGTSYFAPNPWLTLDAQYQF